MVIFLHGLITSIKAINGIKREQVAHGDAADAGFVEEEVGAGVEEENTGTFAVPSGAALTQALLMQAMRTLGVTLISKTDVMRNKSRLAFLFGNSRETRKVNFENVVERSSRFVKRRGGFQAKDEATADQQVDEAEDQELEPAEDQQLETAEPQEYNEPGLLEAALITPN